MYNRDHPPLPSRKVANSRSGPQGSPKKSAAGASGLGLKAAELRSPVTITLQWHGRAEPWVRVTGPGWERLVPPTIHVWQLVLLIKGYDVW